MAVYEENKNHMKREAVLLFALSLVVFLLFDIGGYETSPSEGVYAMQVWESGNTGFFTLLGYTVSGTPVCYLSLVKLANALGLTMEQSLRLMTILPYLLLMGLTYYSVRKNHGTYAACSTLFFMMSFLIVHKAFAFGTPTALTALGLYSGWMLWIELGIRKVKWTWAWISIGVISALLYCNAGITGLILFLLPLIPQHYSLNPLRKIAPYRFGFICFLAILFTAVLLISFPILSAPSVSLESPTSSADFFHYFLKFPFKLLFYLLPGTLFLWAPFCDALIGMDKNPLFGKFHRNLFGTLFLLLWFMPRTRDKDIVLLAPVVAVMLGSYFEIVVRRYGIKLKRILQIVASATLIFSVLLFWHRNSPNSGPLAHLAALHCPKDILTTLHSYLDYTTRISFLQAAVALLASAAAFGALFMRKSPLGHISLLSSAALLFCSLASIQLFCRDIYRAKATHFRDFATQMADIIQTDNPGKDIKKMPVKLYTNIPGKYSEYYYFMNGGSRWTVQYSEIDQVPEDQETVYYLSENHIPPFINHSWIKIGEIKQNMKRTSDQWEKFSIYKGKRIRNE